MGFDGREDRIGGVGRGGGNGGASNGVLTSMFMSDLLLTAAPPE
jgi:hypothetical protein